MVWIGLTVLGLLLGLRQRVPALLAVSLVLACCCIVLALIDHQSLAGTVGLTMAALGCLQVGYLIGLSLPHFPSLVSMLGSAFAALGASLLRPRTPLARISKSLAGSGAEPEQITDQPTDARLGRHDV